LSSVEDWKNGGLIQQFLSAHRANKAQKLSPNTVDLILLIIQLI